MRRYSRLPADFVDRLRDLLSTVQSEQLMMRADGDDDRLRRIVKLAVAQTGCDAGLLYLVNADRGDLEIAAAVGDALAPLVGQHVARTSLAGFAIDDGSPMAIADAGAAAGGADEIDRRAGLTTSNLMAVPLLVHGAAAGALELRNSAKPRGFDPADIELATELAYLAAAAVEEHRGDRFLFGLFAGALPAALDGERGDEADGLREELERWLTELRQTAAWREQLELVAQVRELCAGGEESVELARQILAALVDNERRRRAMVEY